MLCKTTSFIQRDEDDDGTSETCNNKTYTHPAITFWDKELTGFWKGKFEISALTNSACYTNETIVSNCNKTSIIPLVKTDVKSYRNAQIGIYETNIMLMNDSNNIYGFNVSDDTHMINNME